MKKQKNKNQHRVMFDMRGACEYSGRTRKELLDLIKKGVIEPIVQWKSGSFVIHKMELDKLSE